MNSAEFEATIKDGKIDVPRQYQNKFFTNVKVFILDNMTFAKNPTTDYGFGALSELADSSRRAKEKDAWRNRVIKKYASG